MVEMAIVLVIISLLVGGIILGENLIRQYEIRKTVSRIDQFRTSINSFRTQFDGLPGDLKNAEDFWGTTNPGTLNGNGDRVIEFSNSDGVFEGYRAWQQMGLAEVTEGRYAGTQTTGVAELDIDIPSCGLGGGFAIEHDAFGLSGQLVLLLGQPAASSTTMIMNGSIKPDVATDIDLKVDDGLPDTGAVRGAAGANETSGNCIILDGDTHKYDLTKPGKACTLGFQM